MDRNQSRSWIAALFCVVLVASAAPRAVAQQYQVTERWKVPGMARWDYLTDDSANHLLYITHFDRVDVIDTRTGKVAGSVTGLKGVHGVAFDSGGQDGYVTDGGANAVVVFDRKTFAVKQSIPAGTGPDSIAYEPVTGTIWAFNGRSQNATVIDTKTKQVVATVALPGRPEAAAADGKGAVYFNVEDKNQVAKLDARSHTVAAVWPLEDCESPSGFALDAQHRRLFSVCDGKKMAVTDAGTGKHVATVAIGEGPDASAYDAKRKLVFSSNGDGTLTIIREKSPDQFEVVQNVSTQKSARTLAIDEAAGRIYTVAGEFGPRPAPTADNPRPRPTPVPDSFVVLVIEKK